MAGIVAASSRLRSSVSSLSYTPGCYRTLNQLTVDILQLSPTSPHSTLQLKEDQLPDGCFLVERLISLRKHKVNHEQSAKLMKGFVKYTKNIHAGKE